MPGLRRNTLRPLAVFSPNFRHVGCFDAGKEPETSPNLLPAVRGGAELLDGFFLPCYVHGTKCYRIQKIASTVYLLLKNLPLIGARTAMPPAAPGSGEEIQAKPAPRRFSQGGAGFPPHVLHVAGQRTKGPAGHGLQLRQQNVMNPRQNFRLKKEYTPWQMFGSSSFAPIL